MVKLQSSTQKPRACGMFVLIFVFFFFSKKCPHFVDIGKGLMKYYSTLELKKLLQFRNKHVRGIITKGISKGAPRRSTEVIERPSFSLTKIPVACSYSYTIFQSC